MNQGQEQLIRNFDSPLQQNFERTASPAKQMDLQYNNIPPELMNDPNFIRQQQMLQQKMMQQQQQQQQQQLMQQQLMQQQQQQQYMNSPRGFGGMSPGFNGSQFNGVNDLDLLDDEDLLDEAPRRKPEGTEALAEFLRCTGPEDMGPPQNNQKKKKNSIFSFKKQGKKDKTKNIEVDPNRPKHIPLITENDGNGIYSPNSTPSPKPNTTPTLSNPGMGMGGMTGMNGLKGMNGMINGMGQMSLEDQKRMMMMQKQNQSIPGQKRPRKKTDSEILEEYLKTTNQAKQFMTQMQQINNAENQKKMMMSGYQMPSELQQKQMLQSQSAFLQQQQLDDDEFEYKQAPVPTQQHPYIAQGMGAGMPNVTTSSSSNGDRKPNSRHPPRTSSMVISHLLINQQGMEPYEVQQRIDEVALGINENGEIISDEDDMDENFDEDFFSDDEDLFSEEDSEVIRNTRHNAEMRPENCSFINDPIPKARTNKTVQFCEEVGEISDSDYYEEEEEDYENYYYDDDEDDINPQPRPQPQIQSMTTQTNTRPSVAMEDMPNMNVPKPMSQQQNESSHTPSPQPQPQSQSQLSMNNKPNGKHIHKTKLKDEDSNNEVKNNYNMVSLPPPEMATLEITYTSEEAELEEAEKELMQQQEQERNERRRSNGPPSQMRNMGRGSRPVRDSSNRPISMSVNMKNLPSYHKHHSPNNDNSGSKPPPPPNQQRPRRRHVQIQTRKPHLRSTSSQTDPEATKEYEALVEELNAASTEKNATIESLQEEVKKYRISSQKLSDELKLAQERYQTLAEERDALVEKNKKLHKTSEEKQVQFDNLSAQAYTKIQDLVVSQQKLFRERHAMESEMLKLREELKKYKSFVSQNYPDTVINSPSINPSTNNNVNVNGTPNISSPAIMENNNDDTLTKKLTPQQQMNYRIQQQQQQMRIGSPSISEKNIVTQSLTPPLSATSSPGIYAQKMKNNRNVINPNGISSPSPKIQGTENEMAPSNESNLTNV
jgi:hypothetical protein